jgi:hypothetical protein
MSSFVGASTLTTAPSDSAGRPSTLAQPSQGGTSSGRHGGGRSGSSGRGSKQSNKTSRKEQKQKSGPTRRSTFKGNTEGMNGHNFECCDESRNRTQFAKTLDSLKEYAAKNLKRSDDIRSIFEDGMKVPVIPEPEDLTETTSKKQEFTW